MKNCRIKRTRRTTGSEKARLVNRPSACYVGGNTFIRECFGIRKGQPAWSKQSLEQNISPINNENKTTLNKSTNCRSASFNDRHLRSAKMNHHLDPKVESGAHVGEDDRTLLDVGGLEVGNSYHLSSGIIVRDSQLVQLSPKQQDNSQRQLSPKQQTQKCSERSCYRNSKTTIRDSYHLSNRRES
jgi:hypothetical protein